MTRYPFLVRADGLTHLMRQMETPRLHQSACGRWSLGDQRGPYPGTERDPVDCLECLATDEGA